MYKQLYFITFQERRVPAVRLHNRSWFEALDLSAYQLPSPDTMAEMYHLLGKTNDAD